MKVIESITKSNSKLNTCVCVELSKEAREGVEKAFNVNFNWGRATGEGLDGDISVQFPIDDGSKVWVVDECVEDLEFDSESAEDFFVSIIEEITDAASELF